MQKSTTINTFTNKFNAVDFISFQNDLGQWVIAFRGVRKFSSLNNIENLKIKFVPNKLDFSFYLIDRNNEDVYNLIEYSIMKNHNKISRNYIISPVEFFTNFFRKFEDEQAEKETEYCLPIVFENSKINNNLTSFFRGNKLAFFVKKEKDSSTVVIPKSDIKGLMRTAHKSMLEKLHQFFEGKCVNGTDNFKIINNYGLSYKLPDSSEVLKEFISTFARYFSKK